MSFFFLSPSCVFLLWMLQARGGQDGSAVGVESAVAGPRERSHMEGQLSSILIGSSGWLNT